MSLAVSEKVRRDHPELARPPVASRKQALDFVDQDWDIYVVCPTLMEIKEWIRHGLSEDHTQRETVKQLFEVRGISRVFLLFRCRRLAD